jgi:hypothetical protein
VKWLKKKSKKASDSDNDDNDDNDDNHSDHASANAAPRKNPFLTPSESSMFRCACTTLFSLLAL